MYSIVIGKRALKELLILPKTVNKKIVIAIDELAHQPRPSGCKKLKGENDYLWRIRVGDYRILYSINDEISIVDIRKIGHRKQVYK